MKIALSTFILLFRERYFLLLLVYSYSGFAACTESHVYVVLTQSLEEFCG